MTTSLARGRTALLHEYALLRAAQHGDRCAQEELLRRNESLVRHQVRRLQLPCQFDRDEIAQEARLGLLRAIRAWQLVRGAFRAFAAQCVHNNTANAQLAA
jgi:DNA-directed RNA polymerase specialized sigma subunit